ncbi:helix-turn-helix domain-containing protein [Moraxella sp. ZY200743]|uniref:helix-turn-helix domain-containing protein n=1 Tax=Moraxella sp. ZY200743 TaxID=2911970 RepID=UPI003D7CB894
MTLPKFDNIDAIVEAIIDDDPDAEVVRESLTRSIEQFNKGQYLINPATIRQQNNLSQSQFARAIGISVNTLKSWEQGQRKPSGSARVLLDLLAKRPELISELATA